MSKRSMTGISTIALLLSAVASARAADISAKAVTITDPPTNPAKRAVKVASLDAAVQFAQAGDPLTEGAAIHVYSATDDFCAILPAGLDWRNVRNAQWKYKSKLTKNSASIKDGRLVATIKSGVGFTLGDDGAQGAVNVQVQFGSGTRWCLRCPGNKKDDGRKFVGKLCAAAACDPEPSPCDPPPTTTTSTTTTTTTSDGGATTTTTLGGGGVELQGALPATTGRFNYNLTVGIAGADAACNTNFPGTHACTYAELVTAEAAGDLAGLKATDATTVTSFWAIDPTHIDDLQCTVSVPWDYATAHTGQFGEKVNLTNATGVLGPLLSGAGQGVLCASPNWVGCCL